MLGIFDLSLVNLIPKLCVTKGSLITHPSLYEWDSVNCNTVADTAEVWLKCTTLLCSSEKRTLRCIIITSVGLQIRGIEFI